MNILVLGDLMPTSNNEYLFCNGDIEVLLGKELLDIFNEADFRIANIEGAFTNTSRAIEKSGPNIKASLESIKGVKLMGIDCASLANNHILDYGEQGLDDTFDILNKNSIDFVGAGKNIEQAKKPYFFELNNKKIGIYSCAEYEFTIATENTGGANYFDSLNVADEIRKLKEECDVVIVLYHGGKEYYRYPVPYVQKRCRKMADAGADFILCQHSHCIGTYENYNDCNILYGQGNFVFCREDNDYTHTGLIAKIVIEENKKKIEFIPVVRDKEKIRIANKEEKAEIMEAFNERSAKVNDSEFLESKYAEFATKLLSIYYGGIWGRAFRIVRKLKLEKIFIKKWKYMFLLNMVRCEAHSDIFIRGIQETLKK
jgi:poly-gamma-glutamate synthesis protein (capsule biosynthesis protein)